MIIVLFSTFFILDKNHKIYSNNNFREDYIPKLSETESNSQIIQNILDEWILNYTHNNYYSQLYIPSLQGTYYAIYILDALDRLDLINQTIIVDYILDQFNDQYNIFLDEYAKRYIDQNFNLEDYPLSSLLETNCYAILTLDIFDQLDVIDINNFIQFIWSCYNYSTGGFIGRAYKPNLDTNFKIATLDNTYFAVKTLDILLDNWNEYTNERDSIIEYVNDLQSTIPVPVYFGGFLNDNKSELYSLKSFEPNIFSSYYAIKTLEIFNMVGTIRIDDINQYFDFLYQEKYNYFNFAGVYSHYSNYSNIAATSIGLDLSIKTGNTNINQTRILEFILDNRNDIGIWDISTNYHSHELIDTFQVIRSLKESQNLDILTLSDKIKITNALNMFKTDKGFAFTSNEFTSQKLIYSIIESFYIYDRISDLDIQRLYTQIKSSFYNISTEGSGFYSYIDSDKNYLKFRLYPVEYFNLGNHAHLQEIDCITTHKNVYMALNSLNRLFRLDDFKLIHNLEDILNTTIYSQYLEESSNNFGLFLSFSPSIPLREEDYESIIFFEDTYYAIKVIEYLSNYLNLGNVSDLILDKTALVTYLIKHIVETPSLMYFNCSYNFDITTILQNTYFFVELAKILGVSIVNVEKIKSFVEMNINYTNIKNIYYCYKINEILDLEINFDYHLTQSLIRKIYSKEFNNFYLNSDRNNFNSEVLYWICYMAKNNQLEINLNLTNNILLHSEIYLNITINNIILDDYSPYSVVKFESEQLGTFPLEKQPDNSFFKTLYIPLDLTLYPTIFGNITLYKGTSLIFSKPISIETTYNLDYTYNIIRDRNIINFQLNSSLITGYGRESFSEQRAFIEIYLDDQLIGTEFLDMLNLDTFNEFTLSYSMTQTGEYFFRMVLNDGLNPELLEIGSFSTEFSKISSMDPSTFMMPLGICMVGMPGSVIAYTSYKKNKKKVN